MDYSPVTPGSLPGPESQVETAKTSRVWAEQLAGSQSLRSAASHYWTIRTLCLCHSSKTLCLGFKPQGSLIAFSSSPSVLGYSLSLYMSYCMRCCGTRGRAVNENNVSHWPELLEALRANIISLRSVLSECPGNRNPANPTSVDASG